MSSMWMDKVWLNGSWIFVKRYSICRRINMTTLPQYSVLPGFSFGNTSVLKVKKLVPEAVLPSQAKQGDAGYDVVALDDGTWSKDGTYIEYRTGIAIEPPFGHHTELFPRSSISKYELLLCNSIGLVDNGYRGEVVFRFKYVPAIEIHLVPAVSGHSVSTLVPMNKLPIIYKKGDKIGQIVIRKTNEMPVVEVDDLSTTERGTGGFGSTGS